MKHLGSNSNNLETTLLSGTDGLYETFGNLCLAHSKEFECRILRYFLSKSLLIVESMPETKTNLQNLNPQKKPNTDD
ncbi:hypothetical protein ACSBR1_028132 [Camellia fascicularis]